eukprot:Rhum_TRINITY_DN15024_c20_g1::Rhum_TRINITY_DN15024_c20_g1_i1::g.133920::m.133920
MRGGLPGSLQACGLVHAPHLALRKRLGLLVARGALLLDGRALCLLVDGAVSARGDARLSGLPLVADRLGVESRELGAVRDVGGNRLVVLVVVLVLLARKLRWRARRQLRHLHAAHNDLQARLVVAHARVRVLQPRGGAAARVDTQHGLESVLVGTVAAVVAAVLVERLHHLPEVLDAPVARHLAVGRQLVQELHHVVVRGAVLLLAHEDVLEEALRRLLVLLRLVRLVLRVAHQRLQVLDLSGVAVRELGHLRVVAAAGVADELGTLALGGALQRLELRVVLLLEARVLRQLGVEAVDHLLALLDVLVQVLLLLRTRLLEGAELLTAVVGLLLGSELLLGHLLLELLHDVLVLADDAAQLLLVCPLRLRKLPLLLLQEKVVAVGGLADILLDLVLHLLFPLFAVLLAGGARGTLGEGAGLGVLDVVQKRHVLPLQLLLLPLQLLRPPLQVGSLPALAAQRHGQLLHVAVPRLRHLRLQRRQLRLLALRVRQTQLGRPQHDGVPEGEGHVLLLLGLELLLVLVHLGGGLVEALHHDLLRLVRLRHALLDLAHLFRAVRVAHLLLRLDHLLLQVRKHLRRLVLVHPHVVDDRARPHRVLERAQRLVRVGVVGGDGGEHERLRVATEVLAEQPGQGGVTVRDAGLLVDQVVDHPTQRRERQVDLLRLDQLGPLHARTLHVLGPGEVDDVDVRAALRRRRLRATDAHTLLVVEGRLRDGDAEQRVRPGRAVVEVRGGDAALLVADVDQLDDVVVRARVVDAHALDVRTLRGVLADLQILRVHGLLLRGAGDGEPVVVRGRPPQQVLHLLVVDLVEAHAHVGLAAEACADGVRVAAVQLAEEVPAHAGQHAEQLLVAAVRVGDLLRVAHHRMRLARPGLAVREDARVDAVPRGGQGRHAGELVHLVLPGEVHVRLLVGDGPEHLVEVEPLCNLVLVLVVKEEHLVAPRHVDDALHVPARLLHVLNLLLAERAHAHHHAHVLVLRRLRLVVHRGRAARPLHGGGRRRGVCGGRGRVRRCAGRDGAGVEAGAAADRAQVRLVVVALVRGEVIGALLGLLLGGGLRGLVVTLAVAAPPHLARHLRRCFGQLRRSLAFRCHVRFVCEGPQKPRGELASRSVVSPGTALFFFFFFSFSCPFSYCSEYLRRLDRHCLRRHRAPVRRESQDTGEPLNPRRTNLTLPCTLPAQDPVCCATKEGGEQSNQRRVCGHRRKPEHVLCRRSGMCVCQRGKEQTR